MAEWLKAAVLKTASREPGRGFGDRREAEGAKRLSTSYSFLQGFEGKEAEHRDLEVELNQP
jgi:hypothetical protein